MEDHRIPKPFHAGELEAQRLAGGGPAGAPIRDQMPDQHRHFFPLLPFLCVGALDDMGWPVATLLSAPPGFATSPEADRLDVAARPPDDDPVARHLREGAAIGMLGIELPTRRRNRVNGVVTRQSAQGFSMQVRQSFGNCPKYIRVRTLAPVPRTQGRVQSFETKEGDELPPAAVHMITQCETLFVATASGPAAQPLARGVDISHRGGPAGFVQVDGRVLTVPDYPGNRFFNTLGNLLLEPRAALVLADFATGDMLHLQGVAEVNWRPDALPTDPLAQRAWTFRVVHGWLRPGAFPYAGE